MKNKLNRQSRSSGKSLFLQINELFAKVKRSDMIRENEIYKRFFVTLNIAVILYKSTQELNKVKDTHHTSYMVYGALTLLYVLQPL